MIAKRRTLDTSCGSFDIRFTRMSDFVRITDVSPRDGLQNEPGIIATDDKVRLIKLLSGTGVDEIEATSFVSPRWVPQLADAAAVCEQLRGSSPKNPLLSALVPNEKGMGALLKLSGAGVERVIGKVSVFTAASETFSLRNTNASIAEVVGRFKPVVAMAKGAGLDVRSYVSCAIACPFEGPIAPAKVARVSAMLLDLGIREVDLGDTIGAGTAQTTSSLLREVNALGSGWITLHLHDTFGRAAECVVAALDVGVRSFDGSVAGLGGCPYASTVGKRAPGNIDTALLVETIHRAGYRTAVDLDRLGEAAAFAREIVANARATA